MLSEEIKCKLDKHEWRIYREVFVVEDPPTPYYNEWERAIWRGCKRCGIIWHDYKLITFNQGCEDIAYKIWEEFPENESIITLVLKEYTPYWGGELLYTKQLGQWKKKKFYCIDT